MAASGSQVNLSWADASTNESGFRVERSTDGGATFVLLGTVGANVTAAYNTGLTAGRTYVYRVRAYNAAGNSAYSNPAAATTPTLPAAPTSLTGSALSASQVRLTWRDNAANETGYAVERSRDKVNWAQVATVGANTTTYTNSGLSANTTYYYRVRAYNAAGNSAYATSGGIKTAAATLSTASARSLFSATPVPPAAAAAGEAEDEAGAALLGAAV